jgi:hypothetical protein
MCDVLHLTKFYILPTHCCAPWQHSNNCRLPVRHSQTAIDVNATLRRVHASHCCSGKAISTYYTFWVCVCSLRYPACNAHARHIVICGLPRSTIVFHVIWHTAQLRKEHKVCVLAVRNVWQELSQIWSHSHIALHVKYPIFLSDFNEIWIFWADFRKILKYQISRQSAHWEAGCYRTDGRTEGHDEADSRFSKFSICP